MATSVRFVLNFMGGLQQVLDPIVEACSQLQTLKLHACSSLQPHALEPLLQRSRPGTVPTQPPALPHLTDLDVSYCNRLPTQQLSQLLLHTRNLKVFFTSQQPDSACKPQSEKMFVCLLWEAKLAWPCLKAQKNSATESWIFDCHPTLHIQTGHELGCSVT